MAGRTITVDRVQVRRSFVPGYRPGMKGSRPLDEGEEFINFADGIRQIGDGTTPQSVLPIYPLVPAVNDVLGLPENLGAITARAARVTRSIYEYGLALGQTDITAALALIRKATDNPVVLIPEGVFTASSPPDDDPYFRSNVSFVGAGRERTVIRFVATNGKWKNALFSWSNATGVSVRNLTLDADNIPANSAVGLAYADALRTSNVRRFFLDNVEVINMRGDRFVALESLKTQHARITNCLFAFTDNPRGATGGILTDNSYFGADIVASITGRTMKVTTAGGRGAPEGLYAGLHLVGKGVPLNAYIVRQINSNVRDAQGNLILDATGSPIMGREGDYEISHRVPANLPEGSKITGVANDDWIVRGNVFRNCIVAFQATRAVSESNFYNGWGSGSGVIFDYSAADGKSINDRFRDGSMQADGTYLSDENLIWGDAIEIHGDFVQITNPDAENIGGALAGGTSDNWCVTGGRVRQFAQASVHDTSITATTSGTTLTVSVIAAARGAVIRGQFITGPGILAGTKIKSEDGNGAYTLTQAVTAPTTNGTFTVSAPIIGAAISIQQAATLGTSAGVKISGVNILGSGTPGEKYGVIDQDATTGAGAIVSNMTISGVSVAPYKIVGQTIIVDPGARLSSAQLANIVPNAGTALGVAGVGLTSAGAVSGTGTNAAVAFGDGTKFAVTVVPPAAAAAWTTYTPTFTPTGGSGITLTSIRASYEIAGKTMRLQMQFQVSWTGSAPAYYTISLPPGVTLKSGAAGAFGNYSGGIAGFVSGPGGGNTVNTGGGSTVFGGSGSLMVLSMTAEID